MSFTEKVICFVVLITAISLCESIDRLPDNDSETFEIEKENVLLRSRRSSERSCETGNGQIVVQESRFDIFLKKGFNPEFQLTIAPYYSNYRKHQIKRELTYSSTLLNATDVNSDYVFTFILLVIEDNKYTSHYKWDIGINNEEYFYSGIWYMYNPYYYKETKISYTNLGSKLYVCTSETSCCENIVLDNSNWINPSTTSRNERKDEPCDLKSDNTEITEQQTLLFVRSNSDVNIHIEISLKLDDAIFGERNYTTQFTISNSRNSWHSLQLIAYTELGKWVMILNNDGENSRKNTSSLPNAYKSFKSFTIDVTPNNESSWYIGPENLNCVNLFTTRDENDGHFSSSSTLHSADEPSPYWFLLLLIIPVVAIGIFTGYRIA